MDSSDTRKRATLLLILIFALFAMLLMGTLVALVVWFSAPTVIAKVESATSLDPANFDNANREFFIRLAEKRIEIQSYSTEQPVEVEQSGFRLTIVRLEREFERWADQENKKAHANGTVLIFACHELLHGDKELGRELLDLLKQHDREIRYCYPSGKTDIFGGDPGANIYLDEFLGAADKLVDGDRSEVDVLEEPASQYDWRKDEYSSPSIEKSGDP